MRRSNRKPFRPLSPAGAEIPNHWNQGAIYSLPLGLVLLVVIVFAPVKDAKISTYDDGGNVINNPYFDPLTPRNVAQLWRVPYFGTYAPVTYSLFALERWLADRPTSNPKIPPVDPRIFHLGNLLLHVIGVLLLFALLSQLTGNQTAASGAALLFALHPCQAEPVGWVTETKTLLAGAFAITALWQYVVFVEASVAANGSMANARKQRRFNEPRFRYAVATLCFALAILSKASAAAVPLMALALDWIWFKRPLRRCLIALGPWFSIALAMAIVTKRQQIDASLGFVTPIWQRPFVAGDAIAFYLAKLALPIRLGTDYGRTPTYVLSHWWGYAAGLVPAALALFLAWRRLDRHYWAAIALALAALLPVSGLVPFGYQDISTVADRYLHLSLVGVALAVAWFLAKHPRPRNYAILAAAALVYSGLSWQQVKVWHDDETLARSGLNINPRSEILRQILGSALLRKGDNAAALKLYREAAYLYPRSRRAEVKLAQTLELLNQSDEALTHFQRAASMDGSVDPQRLLAEALSRRGRKTEAIEHFQRAMINNPTPRAVHLGMADALRAEGRSIEAIEHYRAALAWQHEDWRTWLSLGDVLQQTSDFEQAAQAFRQSARIKPDQALPYVQLGTALASGGDTQGAAAALRQAVLIDPNLFVARQNLAAVLTTQGYTQEAISHLQFGLQLEPNNPDAHYSLGALLARQRQGNDAIAHLRMAIAARPEWIDPRLVLGEVLAISDRPTEAIDVYDQALKIAPKRGDLHSALGLLLAKRGLKQQAIDHLSAALNLNPADRQARSALDALSASSSATPEAAAATKRDG